MKTLLRTVLKAAAAAGFLVTTSAAQAGLVFTVDEGSVTGALANDFAADRIDGSWSQRLNYGSPANEINADGYLDFAAYTNNNLAVGSQLNVGMDPPSPVAPPTFYGLYAIYSWEGTLVGTTITSPSGTITLFIDPDLNTGKDLETTPGTVDRTNTGDDYALGTAPLLIAGQVGVGTFWSLVYDDLALTPEGELYFISPSPFHTRIDIDSNINDPLSPVENTFEIAGGAGSLQFVPEPGMLALLGISLVGFGLARRRAKA